jgi:hypothetical protein
VSHLAILDFLSYLSTSSKIVNRYGGPKPIKQMSGKVQKKIYVEKLEIGNISLFESNVGNLGVLPNKGATSTNDYGFKAQSTLRAWIF